MDGVGLIKDVLPADEFTRLSSHFKDSPKLQNMGVDEFGRKLLGDNDESILKEFSEMLLPKVREFFGSSTLLPSYNLFAEYSADTISLHKHRDLNACTYTLDLTLYQKGPWAIYVEGQEFLAWPNEAVMFMGEKYEHWRDTIENNTDRIGVIFFHYVEPEHWYFTKGPDHIYKIWEEYRNERA
jgi:hypothetical protein